MSGMTLDLARVARDLGIPLTDLLSRLDEAVDAGLLRVIAADGQTVTFQGITSGGDDA